MIDSRTVLLAGRLLELVEDIAGGNLYDFARALQVCNDLSKGTLNTYMVDVGLVERQRTYILPLDALDIMRDRVTLTHGPNRRKIQAIKEYRAMTGAGLKASKEAIDSIWDERHNVRS